MDTIKQFLEEEFGLTGWMLVVAEPIAEVLGTLDDTNIQAFRDAIEEKASASTWIPQETTEQGLKAIGIYLRESGYSVLKEILLAAANIVVS